MGNFGNRQMDGSSLPGRILESGVVVETRYGSPEEKRALSAKAWQRLGGALILGAIVAFLFGLFFASTGAEAMLFSFLFFPLAFITLALALAGGILYAESKGLPAVAGLLILLGPLGLLVLLFLPDPWMDELYGSTGR